MYQLQRNDQIKPRGFEDPVLAHVCLMETHKIVSEALQQVEVAAKRSTRPSAKQLVISHGSQRGLFQNL